MTQDELDDMSIIELCQALIDACDKVIEARND